MSWMYWRIGALGMHIHLQTQSSMAKSSTSWLMFGRAASIHTHLVIATKYYWLLCGVILGVSYSCMVCPLATLQS